MTKNEHKKLIVDSAIEGMVSGGLPQKNVRMMQALLELIYDAGYNEGARVIIAGSSKIIKD